MVSGRPDPCDCCGASMWEYRFAEGRFDLERCAARGPYYIAPMSVPTAPMTAMDAAHVSDVALRNAARHRDDEAARRTIFQAHVDLVRRHAPAGPWLDIGCGTGALMWCAHEAGLNVAGIELSPARAALARLLDVGPIYDLALEDLKLPAASFADAVARACATLSSGPSS